MFLANEIERSFVMSDLNRQSSTVTNTEEKRTAPTQDQLKRIYNLTAEMNRSSVNRKNVASTSSYARSLSFRHRPT